MFKKLFLATFMSACAFSINAGAQADLAKISEEMFQQSNSHYIIADAYKDGLLKEGQKYELTFDKGVFSIDGAAVSEPMQTLYLEKWRAFLSKQGTQEYQATSLRIESTFRLKDIENPKSSMRNPPAEKTIPSYNQKAIDGIVKMMEADGIINETEGFTIKFKNNNLKVNNKRLTSSMNDKYVPLFKEATIGNKHSTFYMGSSGTKTHIQPLGLEIN